jgi:hypothetical protein
MRKPICKSRYVSDTQGAYVLGRRVEVLNIGARVMDGRAKWGRVAGFNRRGAPIVEFDAGATKTIPFIQLAGFA